MLRPILLLLKGPPVVILTLVAIYAFDLGGGRQPITNGFTAAAHKVGVEMAGRIAPTPIPTPTSTPTAAPAGPAP